MVGCCACRLNESLICGISGGPFQGGEFYQRHHDSLCLYYIIRLLTLDKLFDSRYMYTQTTCVLENTVTCTQHANYMACNESCS